MLDTHGARYTVRAMPSLPSITAQSLSRALVSEGVLSEADLVSLLGVERTTATLNQLELRLTQENILSDSRLLQLKGIVSGLNIVDDPNTVFLPTLPANIAHSTGAIVIEGSPLVIAMVEDLEANVNLLRLTLQTPTFEVRLITADQFGDIFRSLYTSEKRTDSYRECVDVFEVFNEALRRRASDILLSVSIPPTMRVDGAEQYLKRRPLDRDWVMRQAYELAGERGMKVLEEKTAYDFAYSYGNVRFRINLGYDRFGVTISARTLSSKVPTMDALGLPEAIRNLITNERGLVLVTGPTGSGKSTTLASLLSGLAESSPRHLITLEDPIEYYLTSSAAVVHQRELGRDFFTFPDALRQALRQDPDVILVGELRDHETMSTAVTAAETGHLVFATMHTYDAASSIARLVAAFPTDEQDQIRAQLAYVLRGIVSQTLLPLSSGKGRIAAFEIMLNNPAIQSNIRKADGHGQLRQTIETSAKKGMCTMDMSLVDLVLKGLVSEKEAEERCRDIEDFRRRLSSGTRH
jgi:twitching motility protein PilT